MEKWTFVHICFVNSSDRKPVPRDFNFSIPLEPGPGAGRKSPLPNGPEGTRGYILR